jgi:protein-tyrosine phosphatase
LTATDDSAAGGTQAPGTTLDGAPNFRDLGGLPVSGGRMAHGRIYRSEAPTCVTDSGMITLGGLGIRLVCDLRTPDERGKEPVTWADPSLWLLTAESGVDLRGDDAGEIASVCTDETGRAAREFMMRMYAGMHSLYEELLRDLFAAVLDADRLPLLIHCSAGKDRTGFVASMVLWALGATYGVIEDDYLLTDRFYSADRLLGVLQQRMQPQLPSQVVRAFCVHPDYLRECFAAIETAHGSIDAYLSRIGLDDARRRTLHKALVELH